MNKKSIVFLGAKDIGYKCLSHLIDKQTAYNYQIVAVLTNENTVLKPAQSIAHLLYQNNIKLLNNLDELLLMEEPIDILYSVQYHQILLPTHIAMAKQIAVNLHLAPLPDYRGCNQFSFAIIDNAPAFGCTIHQLTAGIDSGPILFEHRFNMPENCWVQDLYYTTANNAWRLFQDSLPSLIAGQYTATPQHTFTHRAKNFHTRSEIETIKNIDLSWPKEKIERHIRATYFEGFEPPYTLVNGTKMYLTPIYTKP